MEIVPCKVRGAKATHALEVAPVIGPYVIIKWQRDEVVNELINEKDAIAALLLNTSTQMRLITLTLSTFVKFVSAGDTC